MSEEMQAVQTQNRQLEAITKWGSSNSTGGPNYVKGDLIARCRAIAAKVAEKVQMILA